MVSLIKESIRYIEKNLTESFTLAEVAKEVYVSAFHLQRIFKGITSISMSEYIRNRRLSEAGVDVLTTKETLLDIALKYQYDSQEGFQKAFYRFHGVNPSKARQNALTLKMFHPLKIKIKFEGGHSMDYRIVTKEPFQLLCVKKAFPNTIIEEEGNSDIAKYWDEKLQDHTVKTLLSHSKDKLLYGPCGSINKESDHFYYGIGVEYTGEPLKGFDTWQITHPSYAVFTCKTVNDMEETWHKITQEFIPNSSYEIADEPDFELYPNHDRFFCEIWVPIKKQ